MKTDKYLTEEELVKRAVGILVEKLGPVEAARFINLPRAKRVESVKRHRLWQTRLKEQEFLEDIFGRQ
jgi:hypothetical protein